MLALADELMKVSPPDAKASISVSAKARKSERQMEVGETPHPLCSFGKGFLWPGGKKGVGVMRPATPTGLGHGGTACGHFTPATEAPDPPDVQDVFIPGCLLLRAAILKY